MRVIIVTFQGIDRRSNPIGMTKVMLSVLPYINLNVYRFYVGYHYGKLIDKRVRRISLFYHLVYMLIQIFSKFYYIVFGKNLNYGKLRLILERLFDYFLSLKLNERTLIISSAAIPMSFNKNTQKNGVNLFIPGNASDKFISDLLIADYNRIDHKINDVYTYQKRLNYLSSSVSRVDEIISLTSIVFKSYASPDQRYNLTICDYHVQVHNYILRKNEFRNQEVITFCYIAHSVWLKGLYYLLEAFSQIPISDARLLIAGSIDNDLLAFLNKNSYSKNIVFTGKVKNINEFLHNSDVCVVPSLIDNHPTTISEALCSGLPVIATENCGSSSLIIEGFNGFIVRPGNVNDLVFRIKWFIKNSDRITAMSINAQKSYSDLNSSDQDKNLASHLQKIANKYL